MRIPAESSEESWLLRNVGKKCCKFTYPEEGVVMRGVLKDRVVYHTESMTGVTDYWDVIDLIEFDYKGKNMTAIRFGYYRRSKGRLIWGSQTTLTERMDILKDFFRKAAGQKSWFKQLLTDALKQ